MAWWHNLLTGVARPVLTFMSQNRLPQTAGKLALDGLSAPVLIRRDSHGLPHIEAETEADLFFAQGFVQAQDRLWQLDLNRRVATGTFAAVAGPEALELDRLTRTLGFARLGQMLEKQLTAVQRTQLTSYTAGINAWLAQNPALPIEFSLLRYQPRPWTLHDSLAIIRLNTWVLARGWSTEETRARLVQKVGLDLVAELGLLDPQADPTTHLHDLHFSDSVPDARLNFPLNIAAVGSNSWAISPEKSATGQALHASDPHLPLSVPSVWHYAHLRSKDGWHAAGIGLVGAPGVLFGHNEQIAWGITLSYADCEDLFIERFDETGRHYETAQGWREATIIPETIEVKGQEPHVEQVVLTKHGPLVNGLLTAVVEPTALCSVALQDNRAALALIDMARAQNWDDFLATTRRVDAPSLHYVYADTAGNIGQCLTGQIPVRAAGRGLVPAPGWTDEFRWTGFIPNEQLPTLYNPPSGFVVACNNRPPHLESGVFLGETWMNSLRAARLTDLFNKTETVTTADFAQWQMDQFNQAGLELAQLTLTQLQGSPMLDEAAQAGLAVLAEWDGFMHADSTGAAVTAVFTRQLADKILTPLLGDDLTLALLGLGPQSIMYPVNEFLNGWPVMLLELLRAEQTGWLAGDHGREVVLAQTLSHTITQLREKFGPRPSLWHWGDLHPLHIPHALASNPTVDDIFSLRRTDHGGEGNSVAQSSSVPRPASELSSPADNFGVSYRHILEMDADKWDAGQVVFVPGQSGHVGSPHYADLLESWLHGRYVPMHWSTEAVGRASRQALTLLPEK